MEDMEELRNILEKVERKIIAAGKIYSAMNFTYWLAVMCFFYTIIAFFSPNAILSTVYWITALALGAVVSVFVLKKLMNLVRFQELQEGQKEWKASVSIFLAVSWVAGAIVGFMLIPALPGGGFDVGLLSFISISIFGMWLTFAVYIKRDNEMVPSFFIPAVGALIAYFANEDMTVWAGFVIAFSFSLTIFLYLYNAFKAVGD